MIITVQGLKTYYEAAGDGEAVVLLHGWGTDSGSMRAVLKLIRESLAVRVYSVDLPGFGFSERPPEAWDVTQYERFLEGFLDGLSIKKAVLIGHSNGGRIAIRFAAACPERVKQLVLVDSAGIKPKRTFSYRYRVGAAKGMKFIMNKAPGLAKILGVDRWAARQGSDDYRNAGDMRQTLVKLVNEDLREYLPSIQSSTLLVWGERDDSTPVGDGELMLGLIPNSRLEVIPGAGHFCFIDHFPEFSRILIPFLRGAA